MESGGPPAEGDINRGPAILIATWICAGAATIVAVCRLAIRAWITTSFGWDDWTMLFAVLGNIIGAALDCVEVHYGFGRPQFYLARWQLLEFRKYTYGEWIQTFATLMWTKISICLFLMRIPATKTLIRPLKVAVAILIVSNVVLTVLWILQCRPIDSAWNTKIKSSCFSRGQLERIIIFQAIISGVSDFAFACYPILILWKVQLKPKTKIGLCCLMGVGVITGACCILRTVLNFQSVPTDLTFGGITNWFWRLLEVNVGIIAACIPAMPPGYKWLEDKRKNYYLSKSRTQLTDELALRPVSDTLAYHANARGGSEGFDSAADLEAPAASHHIKKTMQVDLDWSSKLWKV